MKVPIQLDAIPMPLDVQDRLNVAALANKAWMAPQALSNEIQDLFTGRPWPSSAQRNAWWLDE